MFTDIQGCVVVMNLALYYVSLLGHSLSVLARKIFSGKSICIPIQSAALVVDGVVVRLH